MLFPISKQKPPPAPKPDVGGWYKTKKVKSAQTFWKLEFYFLLVIKSPPGSWWLNLEKISGFCEKQKTVRDDKYPYLKQLCTKWVQLTELHAKT